MFANLTESLSGLFRDLRGRSKLSEANIKEALNQVRRALLEADVAVSVVKSFLDAVQDKALGQQVLQSLTPEQAFIKLVRDELCTLMGEANSQLSLEARPSTILMAGLQGAGKTTTVGKLALHLKERERKRVLVASCDTYRPAALEQLAILAKTLDIDCYPAEPSQAPEAIARAALEQAKAQHFDVLILDTAGRTHIDDKMMTEIKTLHALIQPQETLFVVDSMTGQDAARTARAFDEALALTGVILSKVDGDARGGAALSVRHLTGKPIKFLGVGEKLDALEPFHPDRMASRILGMGDVLSLIEEVERKVDAQEAQKLAKKLSRGQSFDLNDFRSQLQQMQKMGGLSGLLTKLPGLPPNLKMGSKMNDKMLVHMIALVDSMTPDERRFPAKIVGARKRRIVSGSGTQMPILNQLLKQHSQMQKMMKKMREQGGMMKMMRGLQGMQPPGGFPFK